MAEINLLQHYPQAPRNLVERQEQKAQEVRSIACQFGREYFDGERKYGYGGYFYHPKFWQSVVGDFQKQYRLSNKSSILDVGCAKGFMLYDFTQLIPGISVAGIDISQYAIEHAKEEVRPWLRIADAKALPYPDKSFDVVISINTIHNLDFEDCKQALREIGRVARQGSFIKIGRASCRERV